VKNFYHLENKIKIQKRTNLNLYLLACGSHNPKLQQRKWRQSYFSQQTHLLCYRSWSHIECETLFEENKENMRKNCVNINFNSYAHFNSTWESTEDSLSFFHSVWQKWTSIIVYDIRIWYFKNIIFHLWQHHRVRWEMIKGSG
jgi:hypothetical protein